MPRAGLFVRKATLDRETVADLLVEGAFLLKQGGSLDAEALLAIVTALHLFTQLDGAEAARAKAETITRAAREARNHARP